MKGNIIEKDRRGKKEQKNTKDRKGTNVSS